MNSNQSKKFSIGMVTLLMLLLIGVALPSGVFAQDATLLTGGGNHSLALANDGSLYSWGLNGNGQLGQGSTTSSNVPMTVDMTGVLAGKTIVALSSGQSYSLALTSDGGLYTWGLNAHGQLGDGTNTDSNVAVAVDMTGALSGKTVTAIAAGTYTGLVLANDGTVYAWGHNAEGELGNGSTTSSNVPVAVDMTGALFGKTVTAIASGTTHSLVLTSDGGLFTWGGNSHGQLGNNSTSQSNVPVAVEMNGALFGKSITSIDTEYLHNLVLASDGTIFTWGAGVVGEIGDGAAVSRSVPTAVNMSGVLSGLTVTSITTGFLHSLVLASDGNLYTWGEGNNGQLGNGTSTQVNVPVAVDMSGVLLGKTVSSIASGYHFNLVTTSDGSLYAWGQNADGQLGNATNTLSNVPVAVNHFDGSDPNVQTFTVLGAVGTAGDTDPYIQALAEGATEWTQAYLVGAHPWGFVEGTNSWLNFDPSNEVGLNTRTPYRIRFIVPEDYTDPSMVFQVKADNRAVIWINDTYIDSVEGADTPNVPDAIVEQALNIGLNEIRITMVDWGGIVGLNYRIDVTMTSADDISGAVLTPDDAAELNNAPVADAGADQTIQTSEVTLDASGSSDQDGNLLSYSWSEDESEIATGVNPTITVTEGSHTITLTVSDGELSDTDQVVVNYSPISPMDDPLAAGDAHNLFRASDGSLYSWGRNNVGQLGDASMSSSAFPVSVDMSGVLAGKTLAGVVSGEAFSVALTTDNELYTWGWNAHGELGDGTNTDSSIPVAVDMSGALSGKTIVSIGAGTYHILALASDGTMYTWGDNFHGELGNGSTTNSNIPVAVDMTGVLSGKAVMAMAAGNTHTVVLADDGNLYSWGANTHGQLGNNSTNPSTVPVAVDMSGVLSGKTVTSLVASYLHSLVLTSDGAVYGWGANGVGELGAGNGSSQYAPVAVDMSGVLSGKTVTSISTGLLHGLALASDGNLYTWGENFDGQLGNGLSGSENTSWVPVAVTMDGVLAGKTLTEIDAGWKHNIVMDSDGNLYTWGKNEHGQLGDASTTSSNVPVAVTFIEPPAVASSPVPMSGATSIALDQDLGWSASSDASGYTFSFGTDNPPTSIVNASDLGDVLSYSPAALDYSTTYYWSVTPYNLAGDASGVQVWSFTTMDNPVSDVELTLTPIEGTETIAPSGGTIHYEIHMMNTTEESIQFRAGIYGEDSEGRRYGALEPSPVTIWLEPGEVLERSLSQNVPASIPGGDYSFYCLIGNGENSRIDSSGFTGTKQIDNLAGTNPSDEVLDWNSFYSDTGALMMANDIWNSEGSFREDGSEITTASTLAVGDQVLPESNSLDQNFPNPFNPSTTINFALKTASDVSLRVYNLNGAEIAQVASGHYEAGHYSLNFSPDNISSGTYIYVLDTGSFREVKRMVYLK